MAEHRMIGAILLLGSLLMSTYAGIYIPKRNYTFYVPESLGAGDTIGTIHLGQNYVFNCSISNVYLALSPPFEDISMHIEDTKLLIKVKSNVDTMAIKETLRAEVSIKCRISSYNLSEYYEPLTRTNVLIARDTLDWSSLLTGTGQTISEKDRNASVLSLCPDSSDLNYDILENSDVGVVDEFLSGRRHRMPQGVNMELSIDKDVSKYLSVKDSTKQLAILNPLDREAMEILTSEITCSIVLEGGGDVINKTADVTVNVYDVNDNPPSVSFKPNEVIQLKEISVGESGYSGMEFFLDGDSSTICQQSYQVYYNDTQGIIASYKPLTYFYPYRRTRGTMLKLELMVTNKELDAPYTVDVIVEDTTYVPPYQGLAQNKVIFRLSFNTVSETVSEPIKVDKIKLDIAAAKYSLVAQLWKYSKSSEVNVTYHIPDANHSVLNHAFAVTSSGDLYVNDPNKFLSYDGTVPYSLTVNSFTEDDQLLETFSLHIAFGDDRRLVGRDECNSSCSMYMTEDTCLSSCGYGAITGRCQWFIFDSNSSCVPDPGYCMDGVCTELEDLDIRICPQDCSNETDTMLLRRWHKANNPDVDVTCYCQDNPESGETCTCDPPYSSNSPSHLANGHSYPSFSKSSDSGTCSSSCQTAILASSLSAVLVIVLAVLAIKWYRRRQRHQDGSLKHVSSLVSMTAVPSDYIVDDSRDLRSHSNRQTASPSSGHWPAKIGLDEDVFENKWEFPRRYLTLEHVIGEGEFGQVVRAQAFMLRGQEGNTTVAVKMLKPGASGAEYQDLISEFQLLKEVDHPNVIKLLGACTQKGPLYVIVEYCELGSLRNFLRASKFKNKGSWDGKQNAGNDSQSAPETTTDTRILTCRDFFSFAWQIAKGMDYLAGLKIVHRDLAARNVLVTEGLMMKISDFGLSRDVYEADTYLRMGKGRLPVKWMAPESLYGQIYTTKSDTWSYGIVLWEIVTLGASPYPGIPAERLFPLLSTGYRMDRPDDCPEELYAIMQKCWKTEPENRPTFSVLRDILDHLLQQNTEYLALSDGNYCRFGPSYDSHEKRISSPQLTESKPHYSNVCSVNHCPPNVYITSLWQEDKLKDDDCPESTKLLEHMEPETTIGGFTDTDVIMDKNLSSGRKADRMFENLTYV